MFKSRLIHGFNQSRPPGGGLHRFQKTIKLRAKSGRSAFGGANPSIIVRFATGQRSIGVQPTAAPARSAQLEIEGKVAASTEIWRRDVRRNLLQKPKMPISIALRR
jgi:hypothetical protein